MKKYPMLHLSNPQDTHVYESKVNNNDFNNNSKR